MAGRARHTRRWRKKKSEPVPGPVILPDPALQQLLPLHVLDPLWHKGKPRIKSFPGGVPQSAPQHQNWTPELGDHVG